MSKRLLIAIAAMVAAAVQIQATEGINLIGVGPVQQGTAGAGVASAKDSTWLILNPAGLTDVEAGIDASFQLFAPNRTINSTVSGGAGEQKDDSFFVIPSLSASFGCCHGEGGFIGLGLYGTSGMGVDYDASRVLTPGGKDMMTELSIAKATLTYAQKFGDSGLSIGAGPIFVMSRFRTDMLDLAFTPASGDWDTAFGVGGIVGINQHLGIVTIGVSYMTEQWMEEFDEYDTLLLDSLNLPQQLTAGIAVNVLPNLELALDYRWLGWSELDTFGDQFGWDDQNIYKAGITWGATDALTLRCGVSTGNSPIDSDNAFSNSLFPAIMKTHLACGFSYEWDRLAIHAAYIHALKEDLTANGKDTGGFGTGTKISMYQNSVTLGLTYNF